MADERSLAIRRELLERLYKTHQESSSTRTILDSGDPDFPAYRREAEYLLDQGLIEGRVWSHGTDIKLSSRGRDYYEDGRLWAPKSEPHVLSDREAARRLGEKAVAEAYKQISTAMASGRSQPMMALHQALPQAVRYLCLRLIDIYAALPEAMQKAGRDAFAETIQNRISAFIQSCNATHGHGSNAATVARLAVRVSGNVLPSIPHEFELAVWEKSRKEGASRPAAPERKKDQKLGVLDSRTDHYESDFKAGIGVLGVSVIFGDLDDFKAMNTRFGNPVVDDGLLIPLQGLIRALVEGRGFVYAEGGDEFAITLPNTNSVLAEAFLEELLRQIRAATFEMKGEQVTVTASAGIASSRSPEDWKACREAAALANNAAKKAGKDRYVVSEMRV